MGVLQVKQQNNKKTKMKTFAKFILAVVALLAIVGTASAQSNFPDATTIYTSLSTPFNAALTWVIGATAVLTVITWILRAVRRK